MTAMELENHQYKPNVNYILRKANEGFSISVFSTNNIQCGVATA